MGFDWKSLIFVQEEGAKQANVSTPQDHKPEPSHVGTTHQKPSTVPSGSVLADIALVYERGFDSLNKEGYDFFELYKAVMAVGADNPQAYTMAFAMGKGIKPDLSKAFLVEKGQAYITELSKVHTGYAQKGQAKLSEIQQQEKAENQHLVNNIQNLEKQIAQLQSQLAASQADLEKLEGKYAGAIEDMEQKIAANNQAKTQLTDSIQKVINGINQNL
jgi:vacuolar-type H+-ATPase subunit I/STV1